MVNCIERVRIWPVLRTWNWQWLGSILSAQVYRLCIPISTKADGFLPWYIPNTSWTPWWVVEYWTSRKYTTLMASSNKKKKKTKPIWIRLGGWGSRLPQIDCHWIFEGGLPSQILTFPHRKSYFNKGYTLKR